MLRTALTLLATLAALSATAAPITVRIDGFAYGYAAVDTSAQSGYIGAGEFTGQTTSNGQTSSFLTYCIDIYQGFSMGVSSSYELVATNTAYGLSSRQEDLLGKLYTLAGRDVDTTNESAAFQLAVWEIVTETSPSLNVLAGSFYLERGATTTQRTLANDWLVAASSQGAAKDFSATRLYNATVQDFVVFAPVPRPLTPNGGNLIPEPGSYALVGLALAGLALTARRKV